MTSHHAAARAPRLPALAGIGPRTAGDRLRFGRLRRSAPSHTSPPLAAGAYRPFGADSRPGSAFWSWPTEAARKWNGSVDAALAGLRERIPVALALGMANPHTLQAALDSLHRRGVGTVAVVRLFISGASFLHQTEYLFGLRPDPPERAMAGHRMVDGNDLNPLEVRGRILLERTGLAGSREAARILKDRVAANAADPPETGIMLIAHGMGSERANRDLLERMEAGARNLRSAGYAEVRTATLREDWPVPRARAEREIRTAVAEMGRRRSRVLVVPYRLSGFGPYAQVLDGLDYVPTGSLLPHPLVTDWIEARTTDRFCAVRLKSPLGPCADGTQLPPPLPTPSGIFRSR